MTPPRKDTGIFLHRLTPCLPPPQPFNSPSLSIVGMRSNRGWGWTGVISSRIHVTKSCHFGRFFRRRGGWVMSVFLQVRSVEKWPPRVHVYIYIHIYAHKKRWSEEGYVRMSGMGLWNRWMGDDTLLFAVSACATRAMIGFERERERERDARRWQCIVWSIIIGHARVLIHRFNTHTYETDFEVIRCNMWLIQEHAHRSRVTTHISWKEIRESTVAILDIACIPRGESID